MPRVLPKSWLVNSPGLTEIYEVFLTRRNTPSKEMPSLVNKDTTEQWSSSYTPNGNLQKRSADRSCCLTLDHSIRICTLSSFSNTRYGPRQIIHNVRVPPRIVAWERASLKCLTICGNVTMAFCSKLISLYKEAEPWSLGQTLLVRWINRYFQFSLVHSTTDSAN